MHSSRMRTASTLTACRRGMCGMHALLPCTPPATHTPYHTCPPAMHTPWPCMPLPLAMHPPTMHPPAMHAPPPHMPPCHTPPLATNTPPHMPPCHAWPPPCTPHCHAHPSPAMHAPPVDRQTPVKTLPSQTSFAGGNYTLPDPVQKYTPK